MQSYEKISLHIYIRVRSSCSFSIFKKKTAKPLGDNINIMESVGNMDLLFLYIELNIFHVKNKTMLYL